MKPAIFLCCSVALSLTASQAFAWGTTTAKSSDRAAVAKGGKWRQAFNRTVRRFTPKLLKRRYTPELIAQQQPKLQPALDSLMVKLNTAYPDMYKGRRRVGNALLGGALLVELGTILVAPEARGGVQAMSVIAMLAAGMSAGGAGVALTFGLRPPDSVLREVLNTNKLNLSPAEKVVATKMLNAQWKGVD